MWARDLCSGSVVPRLRPSKRQQLFQEAGSQGDVFFTKGLAQLSWDSSQFTSCDKRANLSSKFCTGCSSFQETSLYLLRFHIVMTSTLESSVLSRAGSTLGSSRTLNSTAFFALQMSQPQLLCYSRIKKSAVLSSLLSVPIAGFPTLSFAVERNAKVHRGSCHYMPWQACFRAQWYWDWTFPQSTGFNFQQFLIFCVFLTLLVYYQFFENFVHYILISFSSLPLLQAAHLTKSQQEQ